MNDIVIASAVRTGIGSFGGALAGLSASQLGAHVVKEALARANVEGKDVDEVMLGCILQAGMAQNPARQAAMWGGVPEEVPSLTINKLCGSGLRAVIMAAQSVAAGDAGVVIAGGMESMSNAPYLLDKARTGYRMGNGVVVDSMVHDALTCAFNDYHMGVTAENVAERYGVSRADQDAVALESQRKAAAAIANGAFEAEIAPITVKHKKADIVFTTDEFPRIGVTADDLARLRPAFKKDGSVTAGNASGINDGAAAVIVTSRARAQALGLRPLARIRSYAASGVSPAYMGIGPVPATRKALERAGLQLSDIDLVEANEAFAAQFLAVGRELGFAPEKTNVNGGAIALGHPVGASGARILVTLLHALAARDKSLGLATLCVGGGQGVAMIVERM